MNSYKFCKGNEQDDVVDGDWERATLDRWAKAKKKKKEKPSVKILQNFSDSGRQLSHLIPTYFLQPTLKIQC